MNPFSTVHHEVEAQRPEARQQATLLLVDDTPENIDVLAASLRDEYVLKVALNGKKALDIAQDKSTRKTRFNSFGCHDA